MQFATRTTDATVLKSAKDAEPTNRAEQDREQVSPAENSHDYDTSAISADDSGTDAARATITPAPTRGYEEHLIRHAKGHGHHHGQGL